MQKMKKLLAIATLLSLIFVVTANADDKNRYEHNRKPIAISKIDQRIRIDGRLDETAWKESQKIQLKYETKPRENAEAPVKTEVWITYDESSLYIAFKCFDPDPEQIRAHLGDRDNLGNDDWVAIELDTFNDSRRAFVLFSNPLGVQTDAISDAAGGKDYNWDTIYDSAGEITDYGYSVEFAIPFSSLRFQRKDSSQVWGFNAARGYPRGVNHQMWIIPWDRNNDSRLGQYVKIEGFEGVSPGRNIELNPTLTAASSYYRPDFPAPGFEELKSDTELGFTGRWGISPNMALSTTINPDFSQVEADARQLDLNQRFALYYTEKRPFFTEGANYFSTPMNAVYTRTLADPQWGIKLTGKEGANAIGAYIVRDDLTNIVIPGSNGSRSTSMALENTSSVIRYERDIPNNSNVGFLGTSREADGYYNRVYGVDGSFRITREDRLYAQILGSASQYPDNFGYDQSDEEISGTAVNLIYQRTGSNWNGTISYDQVSEDFRADLGYMPQVGYKSFNTNFRYSWIGSGNDWYSAMRLLNYITYLEDSNGEVLQKSTGTSFLWQGDMQSSIFLGSIQSEEKFLGQEYFLIRGDIMGSINPSGSVALSASASFGDVIDYANNQEGGNLQLNANASFNIGKHIRLDFDHTFENLDVEAGNLYTANITQATGYYHFNSRMFIRGIFQYVNYDYSPENYSFPQEEAVESLFTQLLFSYKLNPRTVFFLGYSDNYLGNIYYDPTRMDYTVFAKIGYAWVM